MELSTKEIKRANEIREKAIDFINNQNLNDDLQKIQAKIIEKKANGKKFEIAAKTVDAVKNVVGVLKNLNATEIIQMHGMLAFGDWEEAAKMRGGRKSIFGMIKSAALVLRYGTQTPFGIEPIREPLRETKKWN